MTIQVIRKLVTKKKRENLFKDNGENNAGSLEQKV